MLKVYRNCSYVSPVGQSVRVEVGQIDQEVARWHMNIDSPTCYKLKKKPQTTLIIPQHRADGKITSYLLKDVIREEDPLAWKKNKGRFLLMANAACWYGSDLPV